MSSSAIPLVQVDGTDTILAELVHLQPLSLLLRTDANVLMGADAEDAVISEAYFACSSMSVEGFNALAQLIQRHGADKARAIIQSKANARRIIYRSSMLRESQHMLTQLLSVFQKAGFTDITSILNMPNEAAGKLIGILADELTSLVGSDIDAITVLLYEKFLRPEGIEPLPEGTPSMFAAAITLLFVCGMLFFTAGEFGETFLQMDTKYGPAVVSRAMKDLVLKQSMLAPKP